MKGHFSSKKKESRKEYRNKVFNITLHFSPQSVWLFTHQLQRVID